MRVPRAVHVSVRIPEGPAAREVTGGGKGRGKTGQQSESVEESQVGPGRREA